MSKLSIIALLLALSACAAEPVDPAVAARQAAERHFGGDFEVSALSPTVDGRAFCGMASRTSIEPGPPAIAPFMVEDNEVVLLASDASLYARCGENFVEPLQWVPRVP